MLCRRLSVTLVSRSVLPYSAVSVCQQFSQVLFVKARRFAEVRFLGGRGDSKIDTHSVRGLSVCSWTDQWTYSRSRPSPILSLTLNYRVDPNSLFRPLRARVGAYGLMDFKKKETIYSDSAGLNLKNLIISRLAVIDLFGRRQKNSKKEKPRFLIRPRSHGY